eukprot:1149736-Pelagomonas_calceolata.AAC.1
MQEQPDHAGRTCKRKNPHANGPQPNLHGTPPNQGLSLNPTCAILSQNKRNRQSQNPAQILNYYSAPILTPPFLPSTTPSTETATWLWNYKQNKANKIGAMRASNTIFRCDDVIQSILDKKYLQKHKQSPQCIQQSQCKVQWHPVTIEKWALPIFLNEGQKVANVTHIPRRLTVLEG